MELLDALRGFALFGILLMNLADLSGYALLSAQEKAALPTAAGDGAVQIVLATLFHGKFYTVFALLFGVGVALQIDRGATASRLARRYLWLFVFGLLHLVVIWPGDILAPYAVAGLVLLAVSRVPDRAALVLGLLLIAAPVAMHWLYARLGLDPRAAVLAVVDAGKDAAGGGWPAVVVDQFMNPLRRLANLLGENRMLKILGVFLIGLWVGRRGIHRDPGAHGRWLTGVLVVGIAVGLPACWYFEVLSETHYFPATGLGVRQSVFYALGVAPLGFAWASGFALLWRLGRWRRRLSVFAPAGRMALTNYLAQSVICAPIFVLAATGTTGTLSPTLWLPVTVAIVALQIVWSRRWLATHRYGPLEGLWRRLTYGRPSV